MMKGMDHSAFPDRGESGEVAPTYTREQIINALWREYEVRGGDDYVANAISGIAEDLGIDFDAVWRERRSAPTALPT